MLFSPTMRSTVLQATAISAITLLCHQYATTGVLETLQENEGFSHFYRLYNESSSSQAAASKQAQLPQNQTNGLSPSNVATISVVEEPESFYGRYFPREILVAFFMSILQYWWFIGLEKILPARPRYLNPSSSQEPAAAVAVEDNEDREEKVVKKWIAQGRVRRASLNWYNTLLKWVLDMTVGQIWYDTTERVITKLLKFQSPMSVFRDFKRHLIWHYGSVFLSTAPLAHLTAFIAVPAHKQLVFTQAISLLETVFFYTVFRVFAAWAVKTEVAQAFMKNVTMEAERNPEKWGIVGGGEL